MTRKRFAMSLLGSFAIAAGLELHRTILFTRARHPHCAARRCGSGAGSQQCATAGALALALALAFWPDGAAAHTCDPPFETDLLTARGIDVGQVKVCNDAEFLTVTYETAWPWCVLKTNLHVARDLAGIPKFRLLGTPNFLRFDFIEDVDCEVPTPVEIPLDEIDGGVVAGETVTIAARAVVEGEGPDGTHPRCLLGDKCVAWGEGTRFRPRLPAMYFTYEVQDQDQEPPPDTCDTPGGFCRVFVTSSIHNGNLGGLAGGDAICNARASEAGLPGTYKAWLSDAGTVAADRLIHASVPYTLVNGETVANDFADLTTCDGVGGACLLNPIDVTETGDALTGTGFSAGVWTDTGPAGGVVPGSVAGSCVSFTDGSFDEAGHAGDAHAVDGTWTVLGSTGCGNAFHLYCFQQ